MKLLAYFRALLRAPRRKPKFLDGLAIYLLFIINITFGMSYINNGLSFLISILCMFVFVAGIYTGDSYNRKPNIASLMPLTKKQNIVYRFVSAILMFLLIVTVATLVVTVIFILSYVTLTLPYGAEPIFNELGEVLARAFGQIGVYGGLFSLAYFVMMYSAGIISGFFKKRKHRNIFLFCVCGAVLFSFMLIGRPASEGAYFTSFLLGLYRISPFVNECYEAMKFPWLCIAIWSALSAASFASAVYLSIRQYNKSSLI